MTYPSLLAKSVQAGLSFAKHRIQNIYDILIALSVSIFSIPLSVIAVFCFIPTIRSAFLPNLMPKSYVMLNSKRSGGEVSPLFFTLVSHFLCIQRIDFGLQ
jgi:hypothetical protein